MHRYDKTDDAVDYHLSAHMISDTLMKHSREGTGVQKKQRSTRMRVSAKNRGKRGCREGKEDRSIQRT